MQVREKEWYWSLVPLAGRSKFASTIGTIIYLPPDKHRSYINGAASSGLKDLIRHEQVHVLQWEKEKFWYIVKYLFSWKWRLFYEVEAYAEQCRFNPTFKRISQYALWLSSWRYLWLGNRNDIRHMIESAVINL